MFESISHNKFERASFVAGNFRQFAVQIVWTMQQHAPIHIINSLALFPFLGFFRIVFILISKLLFCSPVPPIREIFVIANTNDRARCLTLPAEVDVL